MRLIQKDCFNKRFNSILICFVLLIIILCLIYAGGINEITSNVNERSSLAELSIFFLRFTSVIFPALPSTAYSLLSGAVLGFKKGLLIIYFADFLSCSLSFSISRNYGRKVVKKLVGSKFMYRVEEFSRKYLEGNFLLLTGLLMTGLFDFVCYGVGLTKTPWKKFIPALVISIILSDLPVVALGAGILTGGRYILIFAILGVLVLGLITSISKNITEQKNNDMKDL